MRRLGRFLLRAAALGALSAAPAVAAIPQSVHFQGFLGSKSTGKPVNAAKDMQFALCDSASGDCSSPLFSESRCLSAGKAVSVVNGRYEVEIGSNTSGGVTSTVFQNNSAVWVEVRVDPNDDCSGFEALSPRVRLQASPYAFEALRASTASAGDATFKADVLSALGTTDNGGITLSTHLFVSGGKLLVGNTATNSSARAWVQGAASDNYHLRVSSQDSTGTLLAIDRRGNVGINTAAPTQALSVNSGMIARSSLTFAEISAPAVAASGQAAIYFDSGENKFKLSVNGGAYQDLVGAAGGPYVQTTGDSMTGHLDMQGSSVTVLNDTATNPFSLAATSASNRGVYHLHVSTMGVLKFNGLFKRRGATAYGEETFQAGHVNLGVNSVTGAAGQNIQYATLGGGSGNTASADYATVGGGINNTASGQSATVMGGSGNTASGNNATVGGGSGNTASGMGSVVGGGNGNTASKDNSIVAGGNANSAGAIESSIGGGDGNQIPDYGGAPVEIASTILGGKSNTAGGWQATVLGGLSNRAYASNEPPMFPSLGVAMAGGRRAKALAGGTFVWADSRDADFISNTTNQFKLRVGGGFYVYSSSVTFYNSSAYTPLRGTTMFYIPQQGGAAIGTDQVQGQRLFQVYASTFQVLDNGQIAVQATPSGFFQVAAASANWSVLFNGDGALGAQVTPAKKLEIYADGQTATGDVWGDSTGGDVKVINSGTVGAAATFKTTGPVQTGQTYSLVSLGGGGTLGSPSKLAIYSNDYSTGVVFMSSNSVGIGPETGIGFPQSSLLRGKLHVSSDSNRADFNLLLVGTGTALSQQVFVVRSNGRVGIRAASATGATTTLDPTATLDVNGLVTIATMSTTNNITVCRNASFQLGYCVSSAKHKKDLRLLGPADQETMLREIERTPLYHFRLKGDRREVPNHIGVLAEESPKRMRYWDEENGYTNIDFMGYFGGYPWAGIKALAARADALRERMEEQEAELAELEAELLDLKARRPSATRTRPDSP